MPLVPLTAGGAKFRDSLGVVRWHHTLLWEGTWWGHSGQPVATTFGFPKSLCELAQLFEGPSAVQVLHSHWHSWE